MKQLRANGKKVPKRLISEHAHPVIHQLDAIRRERNITISDLLIAAGLGRNAYTNWAAGTSARIHMVSAAAEALGYELKLVKKEPEQ